MDKPTVTRFRDLLHLLAQARVEFIVVGGVAAFDHGGTFDDLLPHARPIEVYGTTCLCLDLDFLIHVKRAAGRPKDYEAIAELETIREEREKGQG